MSSALQLLEFEKEVSAKFIFELVYYILRCEAQDKKVVTDRRFDK